MGEKGTCGFCGCGLAGGCGPCTAHSQMGGYSLCVRDPPGCQGSLSRPATLCVFRTTFAAVFFLVWVLGTWLPRLPFQLHRAGCGVWCVVRSQLTLHTDVSSRVWSCCDRRGRHRALLLGSELPSHPVRLGDLAFPSDCAPHCRVCPAPAAGVGARWPEGLPSLTNAATAPPAPRSEGICVAPDSSCTLSSSDFYLLQ